jgi:hypothetical protein
VTYTHKLAVHSEYGASLSLLLKSTAPDLTGSVKQIIKTHKRTRELTDDLLLPTAVEYAVNVFDEPHAVADVIHPREGIAPNEAIRRSLSDSDGVDAAQIRDNCENLGHDGYALVREIEWTRCKTLVTLDDGEHWVDRDGSRVQKHRHGEWLGAARVDPISIRIRHIHTPQTVDSSAPSLFDIVVSINTDLWFDETVAGETNRPRLQSVLNSLVAEPDLVEVQVEPRQHTESRIREFLSETNP